ncbi:MAG: hypothetical protein IKY83_06190, partial [Proteobacteria bacterium]|nr:hypothetical protein [Pseudomonadota bacterium]
SFVLLFFCFVILLFCYSFVLLFFCFVILLIIADKSSFKPQSKMLPQMAVLIGTWTRAISRLYQSSNSQHFHKEFYHGKLF